MTLYRSLQFFILVCCDSTSLYVCMYAQGLSIARRKARCRIPITDNLFFLLALTAKALLSEICRNRRFLKGGSLLDRW